MAQGFQAVWHIRLETGDVEDEPALQGLVGSTVSWGTSGARVAAAKGARSARKGEFVSHSILTTNKGVSVAQIRI